jgi:hypothetical protein
MAKKDKTSKKYDRPASPVFDWVVMDKNEYTTFKESEDKAAEIKSFLVNKNARNVMRGTSFTHVVNEVFPSPSTAGRYFFRASRDDRTALLLGLVTVDPDLGITVKRPPKTIRFRL